MIKTFIEKIMILMLLCEILDGCSVNHQLNHSSSVKEIIASFPIDSDSREPQIFVLENIQTKKVFFTPAIKAKYKKSAKMDTNRYLGPYIIDLCTTDDLEYGATYDGKLKLLFTFNIGGIELQTDTLTNILYDPQDKRFSVGKSCEHLSGWNVFRLLLPADIDLNQKTILTFQILEDNEDFLNTMSNLRLVFWTGSREYF